MVLSIRLTPIKPQCIKSSKHRAIHILTVNERRNGEEEKKHSLQFVAHVQDAGRRGRRGRRGRLRKITINVHTHYTEWKGVRCVR